MRRVVLLAVALLSLAANGVAQDTLIVPMVTIEAQTWWKPQAGPIDILTPERAADYQHMHLRTVAPVCVPLPIGTTYRPALTGILHSVFGFVPRMQALNGTWKNDEPWPQPSANGEHELVRPAWEPGLFTVPAITRNYQDTYSIKDAIDPRFTRHVRLNYMVGSTPCTVGPKAQAWFANIDGQKLGRGYLNVAIGLNSSLRVVQGPIAGSWTVSFTASDSTGGHGHSIAALIDPQFHADDPARWLGTIAMRQVNVDSKPRSVVIDTTTLTNGVHRLALIADDEGYVRSDGVPLEGAAAVVLVIWFAVQN